jgi:hypothetical protein
MKGLLFEIVRRNPRDSACRASMLEASARQSFPMSPVGLFAPAAGTANRLHMCPVCLFTLNSASCAGQGRRPDGTWELRDLYAKEMVAMDTFSFIAFARKKRPPMQLSLATHSSSERDGDIRRMRREPLTAPESRRRRTRDSF